MLIPNTPTNSPAYLHHPEPVILAGTKSDGTAELIETDGSGGLKVAATLSSAGAGWTLSGDAVTVDTSGSNVDVYSLRTGGIAGTVLQIITVTYSDATKEQIVATARTTPP